VHCAPALWVRAGRVRGIRDGAGRVRLVLVRRGRVRLVPGGPGWARPVLVRLVLARLSRAPQARMQRAWARRIPMLRLAPG